MQKAIFLDRDGTINIDKNYLYKISDFEFLPGVLESLKKLSDAGFLLFIITNQSGIARGYYTEGDFAVLNRWFISELNKHGIIITDIYYCPHHPEAKVEKYRISCDCRKPKLGMFYKAISQYNIDLNKSFAVGDKERDLEICKKTPVRGILLYSDLEKSIEKSNNCFKIKGGLKEALDIILKEE